MNRLLSGHRESIAIALDALPDGIRKRLGHVDFLTGTDPLFAGLHTQEQASYGRSYRSIAHYASPHYGAVDTTIVLPLPQEPAVIIHELGHALDEVLGFRLHATPVTWYGATNRVEAFAEAWAAWIAARSGLGLDRYAEAIVRLDPVSSRYFEDLT